MAKTSETAFNAVLAEVLRGKHRGWSVGAEQTRVLRAESGTRAGALRPDILVRLPGGLPVAVETEYAPAHTVEADAAGRLNLSLADTGQPVEHAMALQIPAELRNFQDDLPARIAAAEFRYCVLSSAAGEADRWPDSDWLRGGIDDVAGAIELVALSEARVARGVEILEHGVGIAANRLRENALHFHPDTLGRIAGILHQEDSVQTSRMATAILANALSFHTAIAGLHRIPPLGDLHDELGSLSNLELLRCWQRILAEINYWPIFAIASDILRAIPARTVRTVLAPLETVAGQLADIGATSMHDLSGRMFQRLIVDRKFLATFYTLPASSVLLAELAVPRLDTDWADPEAVTGLRIADFACGTGALIGAAYRAVRARARRAGLDDGELHGRMMEHALVAADIMPAATHLTASTLSGAHPGRVFSDTKIVTMPYGQRHPHPIAIGSLDLIMEEAALSLFGTRMRQVRGTGGDGGRESAIRTDLAHGTMDIVIMNPPFTRPTNHESTTVPIPSFAGFETSEKEQYAMARRLAEMRPSCRAGHGNAGLASNFVDLAHVKVRDGGIVALVLPAACIGGGSWANMRKLLLDEYRDILVVAIAAEGSTDRAFSADTGMAEVLIVARKGRGGDGGVRFVNLHGRPRMPLEAAETARAIRNMPVGDRHGLLHVGGRAGNFIRAALCESGCVGVRESFVAVTAMGLGEGRLVLRRLRGDLRMPTARLGALGSRGAYHLDIASGHGGATPRGPFEMVPLAPGGAAAYPALWRHDAGRETRLVVEPDSEGRPRAGCDDRAEALWDSTASRLHFSLDFQLNSQPLAACLTPGPAIGGRAWPNFRLSETDWEPAVLLWSNTTLGLLCSWWHGTRQQQGRVIMTITTLPDLPVIDPREFTADQLRRAGGVFEAFRGRTLLPANEAWRDETRQALDRAFLVDCLNLPDAVLDPLDVLRKQWCAEPSVHGGKATRPP